MLGHARIPGFDGGFLGVDIFFVISGYLITAIILDELQVGRFSLIGFYERRIRRIFPALIAVICVSAIAAWFYFLPADLLSFGKSMAAAMLSVSNFYFNAQINYFFPAATLLPLLHTWSLAVEEQFYILFPLLLMALARWCPSRRVLLGVTLTLAAVSFAISVSMVHAKLPAAFYLPHSRAWELLVGAVLAMGLLPTIRHSALRNGAALAGVGLIVYALLRYELDVIFPGAAALYPVLGAALLLHAGKDGLKTWAGRALSFAPLVGVGLISYSLYLWHWPVMAFYRYITLLDERAFTPTEQAALIAVSFVLATLSWKYIEQPFRTPAGKKRFPRKRLYRLAGVACAGILLIAGVFWAGKGFPARFSPDQIRIASYLRQNKHTLVNRCFVRGLPPSWTRTARNLPACMMPNPAKKQHFLMIGDSHAAHLIRAMRLTFPELDIAYAAGASCLVLPSDAKIMQGCQPLRQHFFGKHLPKRLGQTVILSESWERYEGEKSEQPLTELTKTIAAIRAAGSDVILLGQTPIYNADVPKLLAMDARAFAPASDYMDRDRVLNAEARIKDFAREQGVRYISLYDLLCPNDACALQTPEGVPVYTDRDHLTQEGALMLLKMMKESRQFP